MLSPEEIEQMINQKIDQVINQKVNQVINQRIEPLTEEIAALKAQLGKVDLLAIDSRNIRQSLERLETAQERLEAAQGSLKLDFERQEKRIVHFERQTNDQLTSMNNRFASMEEQLTETDGKVVGLQTEMRQRFTEHAALLQQILERLPEK